MRGRSSREVCTLQVIKTAVQCSRKKRTNAIHAKLAELKQPLHNKSLEVVEGASILTLPELHSHLCILWCTWHPTRVDLEHVFETAHNLFSVLEATLRSKIFPLDARNLLPRDSILDDLVVQGLVAIDGRLVLDAEELISEGS